MESPFCNRVSEITRNLEDLAAEVPVEPILHVPGTLNPADIPTRSSSTVADLQPDSTWMSGPGFLYSERDAMPLSRKFLDRNQPDMPAEVMRAKKVSLLAAQMGQVEPDNPEVISAKIGALAIKENLDLKLYRLAEDLMTHTNNLDKATNSMARLVKAVLTRTRDKVEEPITPSDIALASKLLVAVFK